MLSGSGSPMKRRLRMSKPGPSPRRGPTSAPKLHAHSYDARLHVGCRRRSEGGRRWIPAAVTEKLWTSMGRN